jgi:CHAT domain-containing protein
MQIFYENLQRGQGVGASLRIAQKEFIERGAHPYFWSPFALIGR